MEWLAGASLIGGLFGAGSSEYSADRAYEANERTNEMNYRIWQEQQQHNIDMFNMENEANMQNWRTQFDAQNAYNDPSAVYQRYLNAGINPQLAFGSGAGTTAGNAQMKSATAVPAQAPTWQNPSDVAFQSPLQGFMNGALGGLQQLASAYQMFNAGKNQGSQAKTNDALRSFQVQDLTESYKLKQAQQYQTWQLGDLYYNQAEVASRTQEVQVMQANEQLRFMQLRNTQMFLSNEQQTILNQWLPAEKQVAFDMAIAGVTNAYLNGELTKQQAITEGTKRLKMLSDIKVNDAEIRYKDALTENVEAQTVGVALDNNLKSWDLYSAQKLTEKYIEAKLMSYDAEISGYGLEIASNNYQRRLYEPETWYDYGRSFFHEVGEYLRGAFGGLLSGSFDLGKPFQGNNRRPIGFIGRIK